MKRLIEKIVEVQNPTVAGLDPTLAYIPDYLKQKCFRKHGENLKGAAEAIIAFNKELIDNLYDIVPAVKPQCAYYELYGYEGMRALDATIRYAKEKGMFVIADGKRNDIGSTASAYSKAFLGKTEIDEISVHAFPADALTVNGYLGTDGVEPFTQLCYDGEKCIFVLVKTSNPSSGELQDKLCEGKEIYKVMADLVSNWGEDTYSAYGYTSVGAVVGATYPKMLSDLRRMYKNTFFLVPGYGAQGGSASDVKGAFDERGLGAIINSSRAIMCAYKKGYKEEEFGIAARNEAVRMRDELLDIIGRKIVLR